MIKNKRRKKQCVLVSLGTFLTQNKIRDAFLHSKRISLLFQMKFEYGKWNETWRKIRSYDILRFKNKSKNSHFQLCKWPNLFDEAHWPIRHIHNNTSLWKYCNSTCQGNRLPLMLYCVWIWYSYILSIPVSLQWDIMEELLRGTQLQHIFLKYVRENPKAGY